MKTCCCCWCCLDDDADDETNAVDGCDDDDGKSAPAAEVQATVVRKLLNKTRLWMDTAVAALKCMIIMIDLLLID